MKEFILGNAFELELSGFDGVISDPPFTRSTATNCPVADRLGEDDYSNKAFLGLADVATGRDGFLVVFANFPNAAELHAESKSTPWKWVATQVWDKRPTRSWVAWSRPLKCVEYVLYFVKGKKRLSFKDGTVKPGVKRKSFGGAMKAKGEANTAEFSYGMYEEIMAIRSPRAKDRFHPTQKPIEWSARLARIVGRDSLVLDPFAGSCALLSAFPNSVGVDLKKWVR